MPNCVQEYIAIVCSICTNDDKYIMLWLEQINQTIQDLTKALKLVIVLNWQSVRNRFDTRSHIESSWFDIAILAWINDYILMKQWDVITYPDNPDPDSTGG